MGALEPLNRFAIICAAESDHTEQVGGAGPVQLTVQNPEYRIGRFDVFAGTARITQYGPGLTAQKQIVGNHRRQSVPMVVDESRSLLDDLHVFATLVGKGQLNNFQFRHLVGDHAPTAGRGVKNFEVLESFQMEKISGAQDNAILHSRVTRIGHQGDRCGIPALQPVETGAGELERAHVVFSEEGPPGFVPGFAVQGLITQRAVGHAADSPMSALFTAHIAPPQPQWSPTGR